MTKLILRGWTHGSLGILATTWLFPTLGGWLLQLFGQRLGILLQLCQQPGCGWGSTHLHLSTTKDVYTFMRTIQANRQESCSYQGCHVLILQDRQYLWQLGTQGGIMLVRSSTFDRALVLYGAKRTTYLHGAVLAEYNTRNAQPVRTSFD
jgi:hypothetical protein